MKCQTCKTNESEWAFQPFGPDEKWSFSFPGSHYRGFPVIKVCGHCKDIIENPYNSIESRKRLEFDYKKKHYSIFENSVSEVKK